MEMTTEKLIQLRKIRDHIGMITTNKKLSHDENDHVMFAVSELGKFIDSFGAPFGIGRPQHPDSENEWEAFL